MLMTAHHITVRYLPNKVDDVISVLKLEQYARPVNIGSVL